MNITGINSYQNYNSHQSILENKIKNKSIYFQSNNVPEAQFYSANNSVAFKGIVPIVQENILPLLLGATTSLILATTNLSVRYAQSKEFEEKMALSNLPQKLHYKSVKNVDEGVRFAKEVLKIPEVEGDFTLDAINTINKSIVRVSNLYKGKLFMPKSLSFTKLANANGCVTLRVYSKNFAQICFNSDSFCGDYYDRLTVFHEMGHLQDFKQYVDENKKAIKQMYKNSDKKGISNMIDMRYITKSVLDSEKYEQYKSNPELLKKTYPLFYEFLQNDATQNIAGKLCQHAKQGIGELVACIFQNRVAQENLPDGAIDLYKKYHGPTEVL